MKNLIIIGVFACVASAFCEVRKASEQSRTYDNAYFQERMIKSASQASRVGGLILRPAVGRIAILHGKTAFSASAVQKLANGFSRQFKMNFAQEQVGDFDILKAKEIMAKQGVTVAIFIIDDDKLPMSLVSMEQRWAMLNVKDFAKDASPEVAEKRLRRGAARVVKSLFSCVDTRKGAKAVTAPSDLECLPADPIDGQSLLMMVHGIPSYGVVPARLETYKKACVEGWAPAPTNDIQRAVWDEVHALPTKPLTIEPESKAKAGNK